MTGRNVFITGAGRGLGLGLAQHFAAAGDRVIGAVRSPESAPELAAIADNVVQLDVTDRPSIETIAASLSELGHLDVLVNNSGIDSRALGGSREAAGIHDLDPDYFMGQIEVNAVGPMLVTRALTALLTARPPGGEPAIIMNVSSQLGSMVVGDTGGRDVGYNASKAALNMITVKTAVALGDRGVCTICVHPGWVQTDMGGSTAAVTIDESASGLKSVIDNLTMADNGRFLCWDGSEHPW